MQTTTANQDAVDKGYTLDWLPIPVVAMDTGHTIVYINQAAAAVAGRRPEDCVGKKFWEVLYDSPACRAETCAAGEAVRTGRVSTGEARFRVQGREWPVRVICSPRHDQDRKIVGCFQVMYEAKEEIHVSNEIMRLVQAGREGHLHERGKVDEFKGNFRALVEGMNSLLDAFVAPLAETSAVLARIAACDLKARVEGNYQGDHARLKDDINRLAIDLHASFQSFTESSVALAASSEELATVSQQLAGNAEETAVQADVVSAASKEVSTNVSAVASAAEQMRASIRAISQNSNEAASMARKAVDFVHSTNTTVSKLGESSKDIGNVSKVITAIAQQTNLLALNAAIEAARAGEFGKGFAVVANEVKELAKKTAQATEEIGRRIELIQTDTKGAVRAIETIGSVVEQIHGLSNSIASAVNEQAMTTNEISRGVTEAATGTSEIARNISGVAVAAKNTTQGAHDTHTASKDLSHMAGRLQGVLQRYKL